MNSINNCLYEDSNINSLEEDLNIFGDVRNTPWFKNTIFIVLFNQVDKLQQYIFKYGINGKISLPKCVQQYIEKPNKVKNIKFAKIKKFMFFFIFFSCFMMIYIVWMK